MRKRRHHNTKASRTIKLGKTRKDAKRLSRKLLNKRRGVMRPQKPKTFCSECGAPIYDNPDPNRDVVCPNCSSNKVGAVNVLEKKIKTDFKDTKDFNEKVEMFDVQSKRKYHVGTKLREIRKAKGLSQKILALQLGCSERHLRRMEQGYIALNKAALSFLVYRGNRT